MSRKCKLLIIGVYLLLLITCIVSIISIPPKLEYKNIYEKVSTSPTRYIIPKETLVDSCMMNIIELDKHTKIHLDSLLAYQDDILSKMVEIEYKNEILISDLRQETNNVINKMNGWLGFWIAVLALIGGLFPIVIQSNYFDRQQHEYEEAYKKMSAQYEEFYHNSDATLDEIIQRSSRAINNNMLCTYINSICVNLDNQLLADNDIRNSLQNHLSNRVLELLSDSALLLYDSSSQQLRVENEPYVIVQLVQVSALLERYQLINDNRRRDIYEIRFRIAEYLRELLLGEECRDGSIERMDIYNRFIRILRECLNNPSRL